MPEEFVRVAQLGDIAPGSVKRVEVGRDEILLANVDGQIYACDDVCSHAYASLSEGDLNGVEVECPLHGSIFNVKTGEVITSPADENLRTFEVRVGNGDVFVGPEKQA